jgi:alkylhydroperoxidase family enzyme
MLKWFLTKMIKAGERQIGVEIDYAYHLRDVAPFRLMRLSMIKTVEGTRKHTPADAYHAAGMAAAMNEDCGQCVQIHVNLALKDGVPGDVLQDLVARKFEQAPGDAVLGFRYGEAVARGEECSELRDKIRDKWGEPGLIEIAFTIATARFYPALKRGMGFAQSCERVTVGTAQVTAAKAA